jgi:hypothetical protein
VIAQSGRHQAVRQVVEVAIRVEVALGAGVVGAAVELDVGIDLEVAHVAIADASAAGPGSLPDRGLWQPVWAYDAVEVAVLQHRVGARPEIVDELGEQTVSRQAWLVRQGLREAVGRCTRMPGRVPTRRLQSIATSTGPEVGASGSACSRWSAAGAA